tara:strand:- start:971 stop:1651 length:681 start_codon:yes stop_codon:yes gene_type:complete
LGAAIIDGRDWASVAGKINGFKIRRKIRGELKWRFFSPHNQAAENPLLGRDAAQRKALSLELAGIISQSKVTLIACVTDVEAAFRYAKVQNQQELYHFCYKPISERFQYFLQDVKSLGIMVSDHRGRDGDKMLRAHHDALVSKSAQNTSGYDRFIESLFLQDSEHSIGIQIADYVAGAVHRAYSTDDGEVAAILRPRFRHRKDGKISGHGIVHHPRDRFRMGLRRT